MSYCNPYIIFFLSKCAEIRLIITLSYFFPKQSQFFINMFFQCLYLDLLTLLPDNSQNVFLIYLDHYLTIHRMFALEKFETEMWNTMAHIWDIITYKICKMMFLDVAITFVKEKLQLNSNSILYLMKHVLCMCLYARICGYILKLSENRLVVQTYWQRITLMKLWQFVILFLIDSFN